MDATIACRTTIISLTVNKSIYRVQMICDGMHIFVPVVESKASYYSLSGGNYYLNETNNSPNGDMVYRTGEDTNSELSDGFHSKSLETEMDLKSGSSIGGQLGVSNKVVTILLNILQEVTHLTKRRNT